MKKYYVIDKEIMKDKKIELLIMSFIALLLFCLGLFLGLKYDLNLIIIFSIFSITILFLDFIFVIKYFAKVAINDNYFELYLLGRCIGKYDIRIMNCIEKEVVMSFKTIGQSEKVRTCLIFYKQNKIFYPIEYPLFWKDESILIIQNKELIAMLKDLFNLE